MREDVIISDIMQNPDRYKVIMNSGFLFRDDNPFGYMTLKFIPFRRTFMGMVSKAGRYKKRTENGRYHCNQDFYKHCSDVVDMAREIISFEDIRRLVQEKPISLDYVKELPPGLLCR
jgi:hypothetical protein